MAFILIGRRTRLCKFVESAIWKYRDKIADKLEELLGPHLEGEETMPSMRQLLDLFGRFLAFVRQDLGAAGEALLNERADDAAARDRRTEAESVLFTTLSRMRDTITNSHGPRALEAFGFESSTERNNERLLNQSQRVRTILRDPDAPIPPALIEGVTIDREALANALDEAHDELDAAIAALDIEVREADEALVKKDRSQDFFDKGYLGIARIVEAFLRLIDETELADRIRPSQTRLDQPEAPEPEPEPPDNSGDDGSEPPAPEPEPPTTDPEA